MSTAFAATQTEQVTQTTDATSRKALWAGRILSGIGVLFLLFDAVNKVIQHPTAMEATGQLGFPAHTVLPLGVLQLILLALYLVPRTSYLGAILWTGYFGGAIATHVRLENPLFTHVLFPIYIAAFLWAGLWLRDVSVRRVFPFRR